MTTFPPAVMTLCDVGQSIQVYTRKSFPTGLVPHNKDQLKFIEAVDGEIEWINLKTDSVCNFSWHKNAFSFHMSS